VEAALGAATSLVGTAVMRVGETTRPQQRDFVGRFGETPGPERRLTQPPYNPPGTVVHIDPRLEFNYKDQRPDLNLSSREG
jgi:hypothetical protein